MRLTLVSIIAAVGLVLTTGGYAVQAAGNVPTRACFEIQKAGIRADQASDNSIGFEAIQDVRELLECGAV